MIRLHDVSKTYYPRGRRSGTAAVTALKHADLHVPKGQIHGVIGLSGAGKSTLIRCVNLLERPTTGTVTVDGQELTALSGAALNQARHRIGMIFQHFNLLTSRTVFANVALPLELMGMKRGEIPPGLVEAAQSMGATPWQIITKVLVPEARGGIFTALTVTAVTLVSYSAMAGAVGGGGLGDLGIRYGYNRFNPTIMLITVVILVVMVQGFQSLGDYLVRKSDHK